MNSSLLMLVDGRFPAGGHTNSAGVESAVRIGDVSDDVTLEHYLSGRLATTGMVDAAFAAHTAATVHPTEEKLNDLDDEYSARTPSPTLRDVSRRFGRQMLRAGAPIWSSPTIDALVSRTGGVHQPMALGALVGAAGGSPHEAAQLAFHHLSAAVTSAAIRLIGLDPMAVAGVQARVGLMVDEWSIDADRWASSRPATLPASGGSLTDILAEDHARWDARLFVA